jgi:hypothetical protein
MQEMQNHARGEIPNMATCLGFNNLVVNLCEGSCYFSTTGGRIGPGHGNARPGDLVCIFQQMESPFILRPIKEQSILCYQLVGAAYLHGCMRGEVAEQVRLSEETFIIP